MSRGRPVRRSAAAQTFLAIALVATATARAMRCSSVIGLAGVASALTREPSIYGFHATLKAPFRQGTGLCLAQTADFCRQRLRSNLFEQRATFGEAEPIEHLEPLHRPQFCAAGPGKVDGDGRDAQKRRDLRVGVQRESGSQGVDQLCV